MNKISTYDNIIFDLGNVIVRLDSDRCMKSFSELGLAPYLNPKQHPEGFELMHKVGLGFISTQEFCDGIRNISGLNITNRQIIDAANVMLAEIPHNRLDALLSLRSQGKRVFLLSNTIDIHWNYCVENLFPYNGHKVEDYFEQVFLSQRMHMEKPSSEIFKEVANQTGIMPDDTIFIDDLAQNCDAARKSVGWHVFQNKNFDDWLTLL